MTTRYPFPAGLPQPADDTWAYVLDQLGVTYGPGPWPFYEPDRAPLSAAVPRHPEPTMIRISPDFALHSWGSEYVMLAPRPAGMVITYLQLVPTTPPAAAGNHIHTVTLNHDYEQTDLHSIPAHLRPLVLAKITRIQAFLRNALQERDNGLPLPVTAHDLEAARQQPKRAGPPPRR